MSHSLAPSEISRKLNAGNYGRPATDGQIGLFLKKGKAGIHGPPIWLKFLKGDEGSTDRRYDRNF